jgi:hypothetical protein
MLLEVRILLRILVSSNVFTSLQLYGLLVIVTDVKRISHRYLHKLLQCVRYAYDRNQSKSIPWVPQSYLQANLKTSILLLFIVFLFSGSTSLTVATALFPCGLKRVASRFAQQAWRSWSQGNLRGRSLKGPRLATIGWHTITHAIQVYFF